ncbi:MAG: ABC transporter substrate-binding protein [Rhodospirillaceae bacterium]
MNERGQQRGWLTRLGCRLVLLLVATWSTAPQASDAIGLILSEPGGAYAEVAAELRRSLRSGVAVIETSPGAVREAGLAHARLAVAIGTQACRATADDPNTVPLLCLLIPRSAYEGIARNARGRIMSALVLDQPVSRQMALIKAVMPDRRDVAVLLGSESAPLGRTLSRSGAEYGLRILTTAVAEADEIPAALQSALGDADVLLAVPDSMIYNSRTVQNILRTAFQAKVPLIAFSPAYVKAGALAAVYTTPVQVGREGARWINHYLEGRGLPDPRAPAEFAVVVNPNVARALGITADDEGAIAARLRKLEQAR